MKKAPILMAIIIYIILTSSGCTIDNNPVKNSFTYVIHFTEESCQFIFSGYLENNTSTVIKKEINEYNMTKIFFSLSWRDDHSFLRGPAPGIAVPYSPGPDTFSLSIYGPNNTIIEYNPDSSLINSSQTIGTINITAVCNNYLINESIKANSYSDAIKKSIRNNGHGLWEINITLINAEGRGPGGFVGPSKDEGNSWELLITEYYFKGTINKI